MAFQNVIQQYASNGLDFNTLIKPNPAATKTVTCPSDDMLDAGMERGDLLVIDTSRPIRNGSIVFCEFEGEYIVRCIKNYENGRCELTHKNHLIEKKSLLAKNGITIIGVVTFVIKKLI